MPATIEALIVIVVLVTPGFVCARLLTSEIPQPFVSQSHSLILALIFSILVHAIVLPWTLSLAADMSEFSKKIGEINSSKALDMDWSVFVWFLAVVFLAPAILAWILSTIWKSAWAQPALGRFGLSIAQLTPRAWDWFFLTQTTGCWVVAEMDDGSVVGGKYGRDSFAALSPHSFDLYLEEQRYVDNDHEIHEIVQGTTGMWINGGKVKSLHFYEPNEEIGNGDEAI